MSRFSEGPNSNRTKKFKFFYSTEVKFILLDIPKRMSDHMNIKLITDSETFTTTNLAINY